MAKDRKRFRRLVVVLGDQLSQRLRPFEGFDAKTDCVWMAEVGEESTHVWSSKQRIALFLSAMRHFREELREQGIRVFYTEIGDGVEGLAKSLRGFLNEYEFEQILLTRPGEYRLLQSLKEECPEIEILEDSSFYSSPDDFKTHADQRKQLRMEYFYREMRRKHGVLMDGRDPAGGKWNYDSSNRESFGKEGPDTLWARSGYDPDDLTQQVVDEVNQRFADHPGSLHTFAWPVSRSQALEAMDAFIEGDLPVFGRYQDAMWTGEPFLHHSLLAAAMNLRLLDPREVVEAVEKAYRRGDCPLESAEGFIRQILGWREYVRGIYWLSMPEYVERNAMEAEQALPEFFWTGKTEAVCLSECLGQTLNYGYAHHIQRLMVTGLYCLLLGVEPRQVHEWYLSVYIDAVEWVELPNTLGMSQYADGGLMASKPYVATGKYIKRMSNYCNSCQYNPDTRTGEKACPFTVLYWDFLKRKRDDLKTNPRMAMQLRNLDRIKTDEWTKIRKRAEAIRAANREREVVT